MPDPVFPSTRLVAFACDALRYADSLDDRYARRLIVAPFSGVARSDACALVVATGERAALCETIAKGLVPLDGAAREAAHRFARALGELERAYRAQGATLSHAIAAIGQAFELDGCRTLAQAARGSGDAHGADWTLEDAVAALEAVARAPRNGAEPRALPLEPLRRREPEAPADVPRRRSHFSASSLGTYAECERRWYYRYVCQAVEDKGSSASSYGTAFHWALEQFHQRFPRGDAAPPQTLAEELDRWIQTAFDRFRSGFASPLESLLQTRRARRTARRYLAWFLERSRTQPFRVIGTEAEARLQLEGYDFIGYIDRLDRDDATGALSVLDYKTGTIAESAAAYRDGVRAFVDFQLPFYYWAQTERGERVSRLALIPLKDPLRDVRPVELEVVPVAPPPVRGRDGATTGTIGIDELERARAKMVELARRLSEERLESFGATRDPRVCEYCAYQTACRQRPPRAADRFGR